MAVNPITWAVIRTLTKRGKRHLNDLLSNCARANDVNRELLMRIVRDNQNTEYGRRYHFDQIHSVEDYKRLVPLSSYDDYAPYIERMVKNRERNLITAYPIIQYAKTSGSVGVPKKVPVSDRAMEIYTKYTITRVNALADRWQREHNHCKLPVGRGFNQLETVDEILEDGTPFGNISGSAAKKYKAIFPYYLTSPTPVLFPRTDLPLLYLKARYMLADRDCTFMFGVFMNYLADIMVYIREHWEMLTVDIRTGTFNEELKIDPETKAELLRITRPDPKRADEIEKEFRKGFDTPVIPRLWPKMSFICAIGNGGFASYTQVMKTFAGTVPIDYSIYGASEGLLAACTELEKPEFALLCDSCFFEFIPADAPAECTDTLTIDQLETGREYEIILTNLSGFYRYRINDVIQVLGWEGQSPKVTFSYRKSQLLNYAAEKYTEKLMDEVMRRTGKDLGVHILDYCVYPNQENSPSRYDILVETDKPLNPAKCSEYAEILENNLEQVNPIYKECVETNKIAPAVMCLQQPQTHLLWRDLKVIKGVSTNQVKPVRVLDTPFKQKFFLSLLEK